jgi:hypothetical protein
MDYSDAYYGNIKNRQMDIAVSQLYLIDNKLKKISRNVTILTLIAVGTVILKNADRIKETIKTMKGE